MLHRRAVAKVPSIIGWELSLVCCMHAMRYGNLKMKVILITPSCTICWWCGIFFSPPMVPRGQHFVYRKPLTAAVWKNFLTFHTYMKLAVVLQSLIVLLHLVCIFLSLYEHQNWYMKMFVESKRASWTAEASWKNVPIGPTSLRKRFLW